ncbi:hypothetical protein CCP3SC15_3090003 [Gammaproteobacteria bacterium]
MKKTPLKQSVEQPSPPSSAPPDLVSTKEWLTVRLDGRLTINEVETRRPELVDALTQSDRLMLDASGLDAVDVAGIQLLSALRTGATQAGKKFRWAVAPKGALYTILAAAGLCAATDEGPPNLSNDLFWCGEG